ncbi:hypothetical protein MDUV_25910 [Mycolicibacterium duvalii]|uniref:Uncharacterized protein n=1 Tax=Mycolicibacterium duvalii TaxID=39688 RepID=A0A7I7K2M4_9MYCO|nr:hypothetical protein MDUV_25910 [Mycolicibacterium duvalii]
MFSVNGFDIEYWGVSTAILGFVSGVALFTLLFFTSTLLDVKWAAPLSLGVFVAGVACLTAAVLTIVRVVSIPEEDLLGVLLGARVGWGLWLLVFSSAVLCVTTFVANRQVIKGVERSETGNWASYWETAAYSAAVLIVISGVVVAQSDGLTSEDLASDRESLTPSRILGDSLDDPTTSRTIKPTRSSTVPRPTATRSPTVTLDDYIAENDLVRTPVLPGDPGAPTIDLPTPQGWVDMGTDAPADAYRALTTRRQGEATSAADPAMIVARVFKLTGGADPARVLRVAPNELRALPNFEGPEVGQSGELSGFEAVTIGGIYVRGGDRRMVAQKTVAIPGTSGLFVLQIDAEGIEEHADALMDGTQAIDDETRIFP